MNYDRQSAPHPKSPTPMAVAPPSNSADFARDRLRLIDLLVWTAVVAGCLAISRCVDWSPGSLNSTSTFVVATWLSIAWATALCAIPWFLVRRWRRDSHAPIQAGERLWVILALFAILRAGALWGMTFADGISKRLVSRGYFDDSPVLAAHLFFISAILATASVVIVACMVARRAQPIRWRVALWCLAVGLAGEVVGYAALDLGIRDVFPSLSGLDFFSLLFLVLFGYALLGSAPFVLFAVARDAIGHEKSQYRWSHWVGALTYLSAVSFLVALPYL
jgi:hypothetical protein